MVFESTCVPFLPGPRLERQTDLDRNERAIAGSCPMIRQTGGAMAAHSQMRDTSAKRSIVSRITDVASETAPALLPPRKQASAFRSQNVVRVCWIHRIIANCSAAPARTTAKVSDFS
jgi:hypothetical protein